MTQYLNFTSDLSIRELWEYYKDAEITVTADDSPGGGKWATVNAPLTNNYIRQDRREGADILANKRLQANCRVRSVDGGGDTASLSVGTIAGGANVGDVRISVDLSTGSYTVNENDSLIATESDLSDSIFVVDEGGGVFRIGFSFNTVDQTDRIIVKAHVTTGGAAEYTDFNLVDSLGDGLEPFQYFTVHPKLTPTRFQSPFSNPLNPDIYTEIPEFSDVWHDHIEDVTFDQTISVATPDELENALDTIISDTSKKYLIEISTDDWTGQVTTDKGDIRVDQNADFLSSGGCVFITTQSGNLLTVDTRILISGDIKGLAWYNIDTNYFIDQYQSANGRPGLHRTSILCSSGGNVILRNIRAGIADRPNHDMMMAATQFQFITKNPLDSIVIEGFRSRGGLNDILIAGPARVVTEDIFMDLEFQDSCYGQMNNGGIPQGSKQVWAKKNVWNGPVANTEMYILCCNTKEREWTEDVYPFTVGDIVQQSSGFQGKVVAIREGDGEYTHPHVINCRTIAGDEGQYGWKGDIVYILATDASYNSMIEGVAVEGENASYTPQKLVTGGAPRGMDGGLMLGFLHSDGHQYGTTSDVLDTGYTIYTMGWFSVMSGPKAGYVQQFIHNTTTTSPQKHYTRVAYINGTAVAAHPINHTDTVIENVTIGIAPLGSKADRARADPAVGFPGDDGIPQVNVGKYLEEIDRSHYDHQLKNIISLRNENPYLPGFDYPWLSEITVADPYALSEDSTSYDNVYGRSRERSPLDGAVIELEPIIPWNATTNQCKSVIANWLDWYRTPIALGGWDLTVDQSENGFAHPLIYGRDHNPGRVPIIQFQDWPHQIVEQGQLWTLPSFTATDGESDLTSSVVVTHAIDTTTLGYQWVQYDITNADGNSSTTFSVVEIIPVRQTLGEITQGTQHLLSVNISGESPINAVINNPGTSPQGVSIIGNDAGDWSRYRKRGKTYQRESDNTTLTEQF